MLRMGSVTLADGAVAGFVCEEVVWGSRGTPWSLKIKARILAVVPLPVPSHSCSNHPVMLHVNPSFHGSPQTARAVLQQGPGYLLG